MEGLLGDGCALVRAADSAHLSATREDCLIHTLVHAPYRFCPRGLGVRKIEASHNFRVLEEMTHAERRIFSKRVVFRVTILYCYTHWAIKAAEDTFGVGAQT